MAKGKKNGLPPEFTIKAQFERIPLHDRLRHSKVLKKHGSSYHPACVVATEFHERSGKYLGGGGYESEWLPQEGARLLVCSVGGGTQSERLGCKYRERNTNEGGFTSRWAHKRKRFIQKSPWFRHVTDEAVGEIENARTELDAARERYRKALHEAWCTGTPVKVGDPLTKL